MLLPTVFVLHRVTTFNKSPAARRNIGFALAAALLPLSVYHCMTDEVAVHASFFAAMVIYVGYKTRLVVRSRCDKAESRKKVNALMTIGAGKFGCSTAFPSFTWS